MRGSSWGRKHEPEGEGEGCYEWMAANGITFVVIVDSGLCGARYLDTMVREMGRELGVSVRRLGVMMCLEG